MPPIGHRRGVELEPLRRRVEAGTRGCRRYRRPTAFPSLHPEAGSLIEGSASDTATSDSCGVVYVACDLEGTMTAHVVDAAPDRRPPRPPAARVPLFSKIQPQYSSIVIRLSGAVGDSYHWRGCRGCRRGRSPRTARSRTRPLPRPRRGWPPRCASILLAEPRSIATRQHRLAEPDPAGRRGSPGSSRRGARCGVAHRQHVVGEPVRSRSRSGVRATWHAERCSSRR